MIITQVKPFARKDKPGHRFRGEAGDLFSHVLSVEGGASGILPDRLFHLFSHFGDVYILKTLFGIDGSDAFIPFHSTYGLNDIIGRHLHIGKKVKC